MTTTKQPIDMSLDAVQRRLGIGPYDPVVSEIRAFRAQRAKDANYDLNKIIEMAALGSAAAMRKWDASNTNSKMGLGA
jgi:hypothetical protein